jgi:DNA-binding SARP family transcriptional activator
MPAPAASLRGAARPFLGMHAIAPPAPHHQPASDPAPPAAAAPPEVEVQVLGPVEVTGGARPFHRAWSLELVVYLAMHPRGVANEMWATALWPDRVMAGPTLHSTVSAARRSLGRSRMGRDHLPRRRGGLVLAETVTTDWHRFGALAASPDPATWWDALAIVRGRPFDGLRSPDWTILEGTAATVEGAVVDLAIRAGEHALQRGEGRAAASAARRGLLASPYDERLYRVLLRAADLEGNPAGVEGAMAELVRLVGGGGHHPGADALAGADAFVHPDTAALYRSLSRRPASGAGRVLARL